MQILRLSDSFFSKGVSAIILAKVCGYMLVTFLPYALPIAFLIGVLMAFGRLSSESEIVAMQASGWSLWRLARPVSLLALFVSLLTLLVNLELAPSAEKNARTLIVKGKETQAAKALRQRTFVSGFFGLLVYANRVHDNGSLEDVFIVDERDSTRPMTIIAPAGQIIPVEQDSDFGSAIVLRLFRGEIHFNAEDPNQYQKIDFNQYETYLEISESDAGTGSRPSMWDFQRLINVLHVNSNSQDFRIAWTEFWRRLALGLAPLVFTFVGIGFGVARMRSVRSSAALIAVIVSVIHWGLTGYMMKVSQAGGLPAPIAMLSPVLLFALVGGFSTRRANG